MDIKDVFHHYLVNVEPHESFTTDSQLATIAIGFSRMDGLIRNLPTRLSEMFRFDSFVSFPLSLSG